MVLGGWVVFQQNPEYFSKWEIELVQAVAGQISLAINNAEIFNLVRDQSEYLGSMLRDQEIETSRSKAILEAVADGVLVTGVGSEVILINPSARKMLGVDEKFSSLSLQKLNELLGGRIQDWLSAIEGFTSHPKKYQIERSYTAKVELLDNHIISVHLTPVMWKNELLGTVSIFRDISIEVQMEQLKSDFISNISHELRTPLTSIKGYVEILLLEASGKINRQQKAFLNTIQANTSKLTKMVDEILDVNKISSENLNLEKESLNPIESIHKVVAEKQSLEDDKGKVVSFQIVEEGETPYLMLDRLRFEQIINNLLNNAMDYSFDQGKIFIKISNTEEKIDIEIEDQGIGIPLEEQGLIFDRFYRGQNAVEMNTAGAGLGLSIVKTLVEMQGGTIRLFSSGVKGEGVKVILSFPVKTIGVIR
jgi:signal transduction histidine kinase